MQLREAETIRPVDDHRIGIGNIDAVFDDGGADENVAAPLVEIGHHAFQTALGHLPVADANARLGCQFRYLVGGAVDALHFVVKIEDLAAASKFAGDGLGDDGAALFHHEGIDGEALGGWRSDDRKVAKAGDRQVERTRNRRRRERHHVHLGAQVLQLFFVAHPETMLFVDDHQA